MNHLAKAFIIYLCVASISCEWFAREAEHKGTKEIQQKGAERSLLISKLKSMMKTTSGNETIAAAPITGTNETETALHRVKRQFGPIAWGGGFGLGYGQYDYNDYYGDYANDYNYDYYDWVCSDTSCQLCDILTSECCNPNVDINCFLPDSCLNNPCLGGGTCITTRTVDLRPDFICVCLPGLTGKYCQLANDYFVGGNIIDPIIFSAMAAQMPPLAPAGPIGGAGGYGGYGQQAPAYGQQAPAAFPQQAPAYAQQAPVAAPVDQYAQQPMQYAAQPQQPAFDQQQPMVQPQYAAAAPVAQPQPSYGQQPVDTSVPSSGYGVRTMSAKRPKCAAGQVFNYEKNHCADFSLKRSKVAA